MYYNTYLIIMLEIKRVFKRKGITMGKLLKETRNKYNIKESKLAFANRLDPMASGEVIILVGKDSCKRLNEFTKKDKKYKFKFHYFLQIGFKSLEGGKSNFALK